MDRKKQPKHTKRTYPIEAIDRMIKERQEDAAFKSRVRAIIERDRDILEDLGR